MHEKAKLSAGVSLRMSCLQGTGQKGLYVWKNMTVNSCFSCHFITVASQFFGKNYAYFLLLPVGMQNYNSICCYIICVLL